MFCLYCEHYNGLDKPCHKNKNIWDFQEVLKCKYYQYDKECKSE